MYDAVNCITLLADVTFLDSSTAVENQSPSSKV
jgi:hypothetical protein